MPNKLVGLRASIGKTQQEFADIIGITQSTYSKKEKAKSIDFTLTEMKTLLTYLRDYFPNITADEIFFS